MLLTKRKEKWVNQFKPDVLRAAPLNKNAALEARYYAKLAKQIDKMSSEVEKQLRKLFAGEPAQEFFATDATIASQARILTNAFIMKFDALFDSFSKPYAEQMVDEVDKSSSAALHMSMKDLSGGLSLPTSAITADMKQIMNATITENVGLIKSIPEQYLKNVQGAVMRSITTGNGLSDLVPYLQKQRGVTLRRARLIATDQTSKAYSFLNKGRMENLGIEEYEWRHTAGSRYPRHQHERMSGNIYSFANPPVIDSKTGERGIPGQLIHCNCRMMPVIKFKGE